ncbi:hypothetical protein N7486_005926 [Penicillium sp. IBT 16267x]|nr:hypothetical protein N7486_005926 [Penicillium sp. IBT 16267x]
MATADIQLPAPEPITNGLDNVQVDRPISAVPQALFDPEKHLSFQPPEGFITLKELGLSDEKAISPVAITQPFPLFSIEGVTQMRADLFRKEVVEKHGYATVKGCYKMRGYSDDTPFVDSVWHSKAVLNACSKAAGVDLSVVYDYEIGHLNVQFDAIADKLSITDELPSAIPPALDDRPAALKSTSEEDEEMAAVRNWHTDSYPWVCVVMLSDPTNMAGGETGLRCGDGSVLKMRGPGIGWAVMMQGGCIEHIALRAVGTGERITMVTSFRPRDPNLRDVSNLKNVKRSSNWEKLFKQWSSYRLDVLSKRVTAFKAKLDAHDRMMANEIRDAVMAWKDEQIEFLNHTANEMVGDGREGSQY